MSGAALFRARWLRRQFALSDDVLRVAIPLPGSVDLSERHICFQPWTGRSIMQKAALPSAG